MKSILFISLFFLLTISAVAEELEEQLLETVTVNGSILSDPVIGISDGKDVYVPVLDVARILGIQSEQPQPTLIKIYKNESEYDLFDLSSCRLPSPETICTNSIEKKGVYYFKTFFLKDKLQWPISTDSKTMQLVVNVDQKSSSRNTFSAKEERPFSITRGAVGYPAARIEASRSSLKKNNSLNLYKAQPLFNHDSDLLIATNTDTTSLRWTISKKIVEEDSLAIKAYELLSTQSLETKYVFSPAPIAGVNFSNMADNENIFDSQGIYDKGPPRWKAELFINEIYYGETYIDIDGSFSFQNVPIFYGTNRIRYKFTSPIGKVLETEKLLSVSNDFQKRGKVKYQAAFGQIDKSNQFIGSGLVNYGITSEINGQVGLAQFSTKDDLEKKYTLTGINFLQPGYLLAITSLNAARYDEQATIFGAKINVGRLLLNSEHAVFKNFHTLLINPSENDDQAALTKVSLLIPIETQIPVITQLIFQQDDYEKTESVQNAQARIYTMFTSSSFLVESSKQWPSKSEPDLYLEYGKYKENFRSKIGAMIQNDTYTKSKVALEYLLRHDLFLTLSADVPVNANQAAYVLSVNKVIGKIQTEFGTSYSQNETVINLTLSTNVKFNEQGIILSQKEYYRHGNIEIFAYIDENSNNQYDLGEKPYPRLRLLDVNRQKDYETNDLGIVMISAVNPYQRVSLQIVKESISNIFLTVQDFKNDFILTPAQQLKLNIPIKPSFDVRGELLNPFFKKLVPVEILDSENNILAKTVSTSMGKFKFSDLAGGIYYVRVDQDFLKQNDLKVKNESEKVILSGQAGVVFVEKIEILRSTSSR